MSTNYYFTPNANHPLAAFGQIHIGKQSAGWVFNFRGYDIEGGKIPVEVDRQAGLTIMADVPPCIICSAEDWDVVLCHGIIHDEYNQEIPVNDFWNDHVAVQRFDGQLRNYAKEYGNDPKRNWVDNQGFSFSCYEFF